MLAVEMPLSLSEDERSELLTETEDAVSTAVFPPDYGTTITGDPALQASIMAEMTNSNGPLMGLAAILMVFALLLVFRHVKWPLLPLPIVLLGIVWTFGAMGFLKIPMTMVSMSAFPILIGIGIDYAIQFHNRIDEEFSVGKTPAEAVMNTVNHVAGPVIIALFITAAGFLSLLTSSVPMIRDFGLVCLIGLFMCYLSALFVGVTTLYEVERKSNSGSRRAAKAATEDSGGRAIGSVLEKSAEFCIGRWQAVLAIALLLSLAGTYADFQVPVETDFKTYVPQDLPPLVEFRHMDNIFGGTDEINLVVQADDVTDPSTLKWMDEFSSYMATSRGQVVAATSIALHQSRQWRRIPQDKTQIRDIIDSIPASVKGQYLDGQDTALIDLNVGEAVSNLGVEGVDRLIKEVDKDLAWNPPPPGVSVRETGDLVVMTTVIGALTTGRSEMTLLGLVLIFFLLLVVYRDLIKALLPVLPMLVVIGWMEE
jgi:hydrophobe/amphiphile efflux-3 (HAE3) family protein